jgi:hypothetical protein
MALFGWLKKANTGTEIETAPHPALPPAPRTPPAYPASGNVVLNCVCSIHDRPYELRFTRQASGKLRLVESVRRDFDARAASRRSGQAQASVALQTISLDDFENEFWPCAWCGTPNGSFNHCSQHCGAFVCRGRTQGDEFHCRDSCGAVFVGVSMHEIQTTREEARPPRPQMPPRSERLPAVAPASRDNTLPADPGGRALIIRK